MSGASARNRDLSTEDNPDRLGTVIVCGYGYVEVQDKLTLTIARYFLDIIRDKLKEADPNGTC